MSVLRRWGAGAMLFAAVSAAAASVSSELALEAAKAGHWEQAADAYAEALFSDPRSQEARAGLRNAAEQTLAKRAGRVQYQRMKVLYELGLSKEVPPPDPDPQPAKVLPPVKLGPPTLTLPKAVYQPERRRAPEKTPVVEPVKPQVVKEISDADREMSRFLYFQGLKAYADSDLESAKQAWRNALVYDPAMERARAALLQLEQGKKKP